jgi:hypothetical protein
MGNNARRGIGAAKEGGAGMIADLEALAPPLIMAAAFLFGLAMFLRRQLGPRSREAEEGDEADIQDSTSNADPGDATHGPSTDQRKV